MTDISLYTASTWVLPVVFAITLHEAAHGWMAEKFGDDTARRLGRITANPLKHIDPVGTIALPAILLAMHSPVMFGYAKPVPVDFRRLTPLYRGMFMVALAGPATNLILAIISGLVLSLLAAGNWLADNFFHAILINGMLAAFNLLPILPLDGGRILRALLPGELGRLYAKTEAFGLLFVILMIAVPSLGIMNFVGTFTGAVVESILQLTGNGAYLK